MKGGVLWVLGTSAAFLATAGAFLLLANLGSGAATSDPIPRAEPWGTKDPNPILRLQLPQDRLEALERGPSQRLALYVENGGEEELNNVVLTLDVASENTAHPRTRQYQETLAKLAPHETAAVEFEIDLSPPIPPENRKVDLQSREILEVEATTSEGASAVKTAVLGL